MNTTTLYNLFGLARELRLPVDWLRHETNAGRIPCLRIGNRYRFNIESVRKSLAERAAVIPLEKGKDGAA